MDGMLSQEEINALLGGMGEDSGSDSSDTQASEGMEPLSGEEKDAIGEISNISMGTAATTLSTLLNQRVNITTPNVSIANWSDISQSYDRPCVFIQISYIEGLDGNNILILREKDVKIITDLMMGGTGTDVDATELTELHLSAICEAMNQMMGSAATSISSVLEKKVDISPPTASLIDLDGSID
ncbi:MAG: flagellar motor switch phosphatase FliY, partial [Catonella sp.]